MDEAELNQAMDAYASSDDRAFVALHRGLAARLAAFLQRLGAHPAHAPDLVQETFLRMHRARGSFARGHAVVPWAYAIARNAMLDHVRSQKRRRTEPLSDEPHHEPIDPRAHSGEDASVAEAQARTVARTLERLPPAQREAFVLLRYEGLSVKEAAAVLGATPTAVKLRAFRAYEALREALGITAHDGDER